MTNEASPQNNRLTGNHYERLAASFLEANGFRILERNFRCRIGEIDIIAEENGFLCFTEVKFRRTRAYGRPCEAVTRSKQKKIIRVSEYWLMLHQKSNSLRRYDVVEILGSELHLIRNAFGGF